MKATPIALKVAKNAVREWGRESLRVPMAEEVKEIITLTATRREGPVTHNL